MSLSEGGGAVYIGQSPVDVLTGLSSPVLAVARQIARQNGGSGARLRQGVVTAVGQGTVDVLLNGASSSVPQAKYLSGYVPVVGDTVWCIQNGPDLLVLGDLQDRANSVEVTASGVFTAGNWYRLASQAGGDSAGTNDPGYGGAYGIAATPRSHARFALADLGGGRHGRIEFGAGISFGKIASSYISTVFSTSYGGSPFSKARLVYKSTYDKVYLDVYCATSPTSGTVRVSMFDNDWPGGWLLNPSFGTEGATPATPALSYLTREWLFADEGGSWNTPALLGGWQSYNAKNGVTVFDDPGYRIDGNGIVWLRGLLSHATITTVGTLFQLPAGYRPVRQRIYAVDANAGSLTARVDVATNGGVALNAYGTGANGAYVDIGAISFPTA